jgi:prolyl 4-hydroxylase
MQSESIESLERATLSGDWGAAARLGMCYLTGNQVPADPVRGIALIDQAARAGDREGAYLAATIASTSFWRPQNWVAAFDHLVDAANRGHDAARSALRILAAGPDGDPADGSDWQQMRETIDLDTWLAPPEPELVRQAPRIQVIEKFLPPVACEWLIDQVREKLERATIYDRATGGTIEDGRRTNTQCDLDVEVGGVLTFIIRARISVITGRQDAAMEVPKVLHYSPGETFAEHFDYLNPGEPAFARELATRGQRTDTFLIYLNDDFTGGETYFPELDIAHSGATGDALLFSNVDSRGQPDEATRHAGLPPTSGEKWLFSQWIREFPRN